MTGLEILLLITLGFGGGWAAHGKADPPAQVQCLSNATVTATCTEIQPPADHSFGATTSSYVDLVSQYRKCRAACTTVVQPK